MSKRKNKVSLFEEDATIVDEFENEETKKISKGMIEILPLKDFRIKFNEYDIIIKEGEKIEVPEMFEQNLKTEKVI